MRTTLLRPFIVAGADAPAAIRRRAHAVGGDRREDRRALRRGLAATVERPLLLYGTFHPTRGALVSRSTRPRVGGDSTIFTPDAPYPTPALAFTGARVAIPITGLPASLNAGTNVITHTFAALDQWLKAGDWIGLTTSRGIGSRPGENYAGEWLQVESLTASQLVLKTPFRVAYPLASGGFTAQLYRYDMIQRPEIEGIRLIGPGGDGHPKTTTTNRERGLVVTYAADAVLRDVVVEGPFMREGIAAYECLRPTFVDWEAIDVDDRAGPAGSVEGYACRIMGCEGGLVSGSGRGSRHLVECNGGQGSYSLPSGQRRPINFGTTVRDVHAVKTWAAAVGDHPGAADTTFENITAIGCSGAVFVRGRWARIRGVTMRGGHHQTGPYVTQGSQGNDHCITLGETQRKPDGSSDAASDNRDGWCGTDVSISAVHHDMLGNGNGTLPGTNLGSTSHTIHAVHPLVRVSIDLGDGQCRPTGNGVNAVAGGNRDVRIRGTVDCSSAFSAGGRAVLMVPKTTTPASTPPPMSGIDVDVVAIKPRNQPVEIAGDPTGYVVRCRVVA